MCPHVDIFLQTVEPFLIRILRHGKWLSSLYYSWDPKSSSIQTRITPTKLLCVRISILLHIVYLLASSARFIFEDTNLTERMLACGVLLVSGTALQFRMEWEPDGAPLLVLGWFARTTQGRYKSRLMNENKSRHFLGIL